MYVEKIHLGAFGRISPKIGSIQKTLKVKLRSILCQSTPSV